MVASHPLRHPVARDEHERADVSERIPQRRAIVVVGEANRQSRQIGRSAGPACQRDHRRPVRAGEQVADHTRPDPSESAGDRYHRAVRRTATAPRFGAAGRMRALPESAINLRVHDALRRRERHAPTSFRSRTTAPGPHPGPWLGGCPAAGGVGLPAGQAASRPGSAATTGRRKRLTRAGCRATAPPRKHVACMVTPVFLSMK
jgi:hypothetical protein